MKIKLFPEGLIIATAMFIVTVGTMNSWTYPVSQATKEAAFHTKPEIVYSDLQFDLKPCGGNTLCRVNGDGTISVMTENEKVIQTFTDAEFDCHYYGRTIEVKFEDGQIQRMVSQSCLDAAEEKINKPTLRTTGRAIRNPGESFRIELN